MHNTVPNTRSTSYPSSTVSSTRSSESGRRSSYTSAKSTQAAPLRSGSVCRTRYTLQFQRPLGGGTFGAHSGWPAPTAWANVPSPWQSKYATRKYKSHRAIPSHESVDKMLEGLEHSRPELFKRVMRDQAAKAAEEQEAEGDLEN